MLGGMIPIKWWAERDVQSVEVECHKENLLSFIMRAGNINIHQIINDSITRNNTRSIFKDCKFFERKGLDEVDKEYKDWLEWCKEMGCPI